MNSFEKLIKDSLSHYHKYDPDQNFIDDLGDKLLQKAEEKRQIEQKVSFFDKFLMNWNATLVFGSISILILLLSIFFYDPMRSSFVESFKNKTKADVSGVFEVQIVQTNAKDSTVLVYNDEMKDSPPLDITPEIIKEKIILLLPVGKYRVVIFDGDDNKQKDLDVTVYSNGKYETENN